MLWKFSSMVDGHAVDQRHLKNNLINEITRIWIKILVITLIFALVQTSEPSVDSESIQVQKRGEELFFIVFSLLSFSYVAHPESENE